jgi:hypothetical protein
MMKIDEDIAADELKDETRYRPNINTTSKALGYFYTVHFVPTCLLRIVIPTLKITGGGNATNFRNEGQFGTWVGKPSSANTQRIVGTIQPVVRLCC